LWDFSETPECHAQPICDDLSRCLAVGIAAVAQDQVAVRVDDPELGTGRQLAVAAVSGRVQRIAGELRIFGAQLGLVGGIQAAGAGQRMAGTRGIARQADMDLPGQVDQLPAALRAAVGGRHQEFPAMRGGRADPKGRTITAVGDKHAVIVAAVRHPEAEAVHRRGQQHRQQHDGQDQQQLQTAATAARGFGWKGGEPVHAGLLRACCTPK